MKDENTVSLSNQSDELAYMLKAKKLIDNYQTTSEYMILVFEHQLAKVQVIPSGSDARKVTYVKIKSYTRCTYTEGKVKLVEGSKDWITMMPIKKESVIMHWEANVVPEEITEMQVYGENGEMLSSKLIPITPEAGAVNKITLKVDN